MTWAEWLVDDQREASGRPDVLVFMTDVLKAPVKISGQPAVNLIASKTGTDADWVVKLIDVYHDEVVPQTSMGGYQLMVAGDIFRGRYRRPRDAESDSGRRTTALQIRAATATTSSAGPSNHGADQSSWFPLCDRNPQTFVPSIFWAKAGDFQRAARRSITPGQAVSSSCQS
jgi:predicted acyl esterase